MCWCLHFYQKRRSGCQALMTFSGEWIRVVLGGDQRPPGCLLRVSLTGGSNDWLASQIHQDIIVLHPVDFGAKDYGQEACGIRKVSFGIYSPWPPLSLYRFFATSDLLTVPPSAIVLTLLPQLLHGYGRFTGISGAPLGKAVGEMDSSWERPLFCQRLQTIGSHPRGLHARYHHEFERVNVISSQQMER